MNHFYASINDSRTIHCTGWDVRRMILRTSSSPELMNDDCGEGKKEESLVLVFGETGGKKDFSVADQWSVKQTGVDIVV